MVLRRHPTSSSHGGRSRKLKDHIFKGKHEGERESKQEVEKKPTSCDTLPLARLHLLNLQK